MPPRASSADNPAAQTALQLAAAIEEFLSANANTVVLEDGKVEFDLSAGALSAAKYSLATDHDRCTLHLWSDERNTVRRVLSATPRAGTLRLATQRFGQAQPRLLELVANRERRTPTTREAARRKYVRLLERVLQHAFADLKPEGFRAAMDLERSFGPAYARGSLVRGQRAWAVIGVNAEESAATIDGILTLGILWLERCRELSAGRKLYAGLKLIVPLGMASLTLSRLAWMNHSAAQWELYELDEQSEELKPRDAADQGNLRTRLVHHPDEAAARERFTAATAEVMQLVPTRDQPRIEQRLVSAAELQFLLHGLVFARAHIGYAERTFAQTTTITVGAGASETPLTQSNALELAEAVAELCRRRRADAEDKTQDPLFRASPERWLESVLRLDLAPLTRHLGPAPVAESRPSFTVAEDPDTLGNRADTSQPPQAKNGNAAGHDATRIIPRLDSRHVYTQVPAIAGASDRGMLDLLGVTVDGRLAVIELKADDDLHLALQGLDYWVRVRHHHLATRAGDEARTILAASEGEFQRHGYFRGVQLSPEAPRLYLVAPALHIHPATETILRYLSPRVEWHLLALDERWRTRIRVVWRKSGGR